MTIGPTIGNPEYYQGNNSSLRVAMTQTRRQMTRLVIANVYLRCVNRTGPVVRSNELDGTEKTKVNQ